MVNDEETKEEVVRARYDGRLQFYEELNRCFKACNYGIILKDDDILLNALNAFYNHVQSFFTDAEREDIEKDLENIEKSFTEMNNYHRDSPAFMARYNYLRGHSQSLMRLVHRAIYRACHKHNLLSPTGSDEESTEEQVIEEMFK